MSSQLLRILQAYVLLIGWDRFIKRHSFAELYHAIRTHRVSRSFSVHADIDPVYDAIEVACALYPKQVLCLQKSCVLTKMLRSRGLPAQLTIGSQRNPFRAHAWVSIDGNILRDKLARRESFLIVEVC